MPTTTNYGLHLNDDSTMNFIDWRNQINGTEDSNMIKIDLALSTVSNATNEVKATIDGINSTLSQKANVSTSVNAVLSASEWTGSVSPYVQQVEITGLTELSNGSVSLSNDATVEQILVANECRLLPVSQSVNTLIISADIKPTIDIPIVVIILG